MYGIWTVLPPVLVIVTALWKKDVVASLFIGLVSASVIINGAGFLQPIVSDYMVTGWKDNANLLITIMIVGIMMGQINACGGFAALSARISKKVKTARGARILAWLLCMICATDDGMATVGAGTIGLKITDEFHVPREKLAFIVSSTGSNFLSMMPYSMYIVFGAGLISTYSAMDGYTVYLQAIPFQFYAILSIAAAGIVAVGLFPEFGPFRKAEQNMKNPDGAASQPQGMFESPEAGDEDDIAAFVLPIFTMLAVFVYQYAVTREFQLVSAALCGCIVAFAYPILRGKAKFQDVSTLCFAGFKSTAPMFMILFLAFSFAAAVNALGFGEYMVVLLSGNVKAQFLPVLAFLVSGVGSYCTGSFASGLIIMVPIILPLAVSLQVPLPLAFAACMGGSQFGDQSSPVSDIFIMSSMASGVDVADSARALIPYKLILFGLSAVLYLAAGCIML